MVRQMPAVKAGAHYKEVSMTGFEKLENSLIDVIKEEQAKLGFKEEKIHLYYPLSSLNSTSAEYAHRADLKAW